MSNDNKTVLADVVLKVAMMDLVGHGVKWLEGHGTNIEISKIVSPTGTIKGTISLEELSKFDDWDYFCIFSPVEAEDELYKLISFYNLPENRVIFPLNYHSLMEHYAVVYYMFDDEVKRFVEYCNLKKRQGYSFACVEGNVSYIGRSFDLVIMGDMYTHGINWAEKDIRRFYELSQKYYTFAPNQKLFCDIGANIGTTCIFFKKQIDTSVHILAFEPMPDTFGLLKKNMYLNDIPEEEFTVVNYGISDRTEEKEFHYNYTNPGGSSFTEQKVYGKSLVAQTVSFDDFLNNTKIDPESIKYLWVDVEGFEWAFVSGAKETLKGINVPIVMEVTPRLLNAQDKHEQFYLDLKEVFSRFIYMKDEEGKEHPIEELADYLEPEKHSPQRDIFFLR